MDLHPWAGFTYGGKLSSRPIYTEEEEFSWDISSLHECYKGESKFKSPEFCFAQATWVLCTTFAPDSISFGIFLVRSSISVEVADCCCKLSCRNVDGEVFKSFEWKFIPGEDVPLMGLRDFFKLKNSEGTQLKNVLGNAEIVCQFSLKRSTDITCSSEKTAVKVVRSATFDFSRSFLMKDFVHCGKLTSKFISTEEEELIWDLSNFVKGDRPTRAMSHDFNFGGNTGYLVANINYETIFCIDIRKRSSSYEVFDCFCNISYQNSQGKEFRRFELKFKCDENVPLIIMRDSYNYSFAIPFSFYKIRQEGVRIVCRIISKKLITTDGSPRTESSVADDCNPAHRPEQKDDESTIVNPIYKVCQDLRRLLQSEEGSDVILQVGDQPFKAHRLILSARSSVFSSMFRHNMKEKATGVVNVEDCDVSSFPVLLEFLYCGSTEKISQENVFGLYTSSDKYDVQDLKMKCREFIKNNLSVETFCDTLRLSLRPFRKRTVKTLCKLFRKEF